MKEKKHLHSLKTGSSFPGKGRGELLLSLSRKGFSGLLWGITIFGFLLRLVISFQLQKYDPAVTSPSAITDMATYIKLADEILKGNFPPTFYYQPFYYSFFLPIARLFGKDTGLILFQSLLGAGIIFLAGKNALYLGAKKWGALFAALLCAFSSILLYFTPYALIELLQAFLILLTFDLFFTALRRHSWKHYLSAGLVWGASILTRGNTLLFLPLFFLFLLFREGENIKVFFRKKRFYFSLLLLLGGMLLIQLPYIGYNSWKLKRFSGPSTAGPSVLALGNNKEAAPGGLELPYPPSFHVLMRQEKRPGGVLGGILSWAKEEPAAFLEHKIKQFFLFWDGTEYPNNISQEHNALKSPLMAKLHFLPTSLLLLLALAALFQSLRNGTLFRKKGVLLLWGMILIYAFSVAIFYILARFRLPVLPLTAIAGGIFLGSFMGKEKKSRLFHNLLFLLGGIFFVFLLYPLYIFTYESMLMRVCRPYGIRNTVLAGDVQGLEKLPEEEKSRSFEMLLDSSSILQGSWRGLPLAEGMTFIKTFRTAPGKALPPGETGEIVIPFSAGLPSSVIVEHGGGRRYLRITPPLAQLHIPGLPLKRDPLPDGKGERVTIQFTITDLQGDPALFLDSARDYGCTFMKKSSAASPEKTNMELVLRLLLPHEEK